MIQSSVEIFWNRTGEKQLKITPSAENTPSTLGPTLHKTQFVVTDMTAVTQPEAKVHNAPLNHKSLQHKGTSYRTDISASNQTASFRNATCHTNTRQPLSVACWTRNLRTHFKPSAAPSNPCHNTTLHSHQSRCNTDYSLTSSLQAIRNITGV